MVLIDKMLSNGALIIRQCTLFINEIQSSGQFIQLGPLIFFSYELDQHNIPSSLCNIKAIDKIKCIRKAWIIKNKIRKNEIENQN